MESTEYCSAMADAHSGEHLTSGAGTSAAADVASTALSALSGVENDGAAIQAALLLASLAGPRAGLVTLGGEVQSIGSSLISIGGESPAQARLTELLFSPLRYLQDDLIEYGRRVSPEVLDRLSSALADPHHSVPGERHPVDNEFQADAELRHARGQAGKSTEVVSESHPVDRYEAFQREYLNTDEQRAEDANFGAVSSRATGAA